MGVELIHDKNPGGVGVGVNHRVEVFTKIGFGACGVHQWRQDLSLGHVPSGDEGLGPMTDALKLPALNLFLGFIPRSLLRFSAPQAIVLPSFFQKRQRIPRCLRRGSLLK